MALRIIAVAKPPKRTQAGRVAKLTGERAVAIGDGAIELRSGAKVLATWPYADLQRVVCAHGVLVVASRADGDLCVFGIARDEIKWIASGRGRGKLKPDGATLSSAGDRVFATAPSGEVELVDLAETRDFWLAESAFAAPTATGSLGVQHIARAKLPKLEKEDTEHWEVLSCRRDASPTTTTVQPSKRGAVVCEKRELHWVPKKGLPRRIATIDNHGNIYGCGYVGANAIVVLAEKSLRRFTLTDREATLVETVTLSDGIALAVRRDRKYVIAVAGDTGHVFDAKLVRIGTIAKIQNAWAAGGRLFVVGDKAELFEVRGLD